MKKLILLSFILYSLYLFAGDNVVGDYVTARKSVNATDSVVSRMQVLKKITYFPSIYTTRPGTIINYKDSGLYRFTGVSWLKLETDTTSLSKRIDVNTDSINSIYDSLLVHNDSIQNYDKRIKSAGKTYYANSGLYLHGDTVKFGGTARINSIDFTLNTSDDYGAIHGDNGSDLLLFGKNYETGNLYSNIGVGGVGFFKVEDSIFVEVQKRDPLIPALNYVFDTAGIRLDRNVDTALFTDNHLVPKKWVENAISNSGGKVYANSGLRKDGDTIKLGDADLFVRYGYTVIPVKDMLYIGDTSFNKLSMFFINTPENSRSWYINASDDYGANQGTISAFPKFIQMAQNYRDILIDSINIKFRYKSVTVASIDSNGYINGRTERVLKTFYTDSSTISTTETPLYRYTLPANTLTKNGDILTCYYYIDDNGTTGGVMKFYFGSLAFTITNASGALSEILKFTITRISSTSVRIIGEWVNGNVASTFPLFNDVTVTLSNTVLIKLSMSVLTGTATAKSGYIEYKPAQ